MFNTFDNSRERGLSDFHMQHRFLVDYSIDLPSPGSGPTWVRHLLRGWGLMGIINLTSGQPFDVFVSSNRSGSLFGSPVPSGQGVDRPNLAAGRTHEDAILGGPDRYFDPSAFELQPSGFYGNLGRNSLIGPGFAKLDLALVNRRVLPAWGRELGMEFRLEVFNLFNRPNFGFPDRVVFSGAVNDELPLSNAGLIRPPTVSSSRQLQIALRVRF